MSQSDGLNRAIDLSVPGRRKKSSPFLLLAIGLAVTIIGLPFAWAHLKLALLTLAPVGTAVVTTPRRFRAF